tara:strand:+ start:232 stop:1290 length:1059 start_codon:yes stop_codon:yes gene_type:complete
VLNLKIFVTGGLGFIGSNYILNKINDNSVKILNYDKITYAANPQNLLSIDSNPNYHFVKGDICDAFKLSESINDFQPDIIINFAAESHVDRSIDSPMDFIQTNVVGTVNLLETSTNYYNKLNDKDGFAFLHISTDEVFGELGESGSFRESTPYDPSSPYSASKASSDHFVRAWTKTFGLPAMISNCSNNFGPFQFPEKLIPLMIIKCIDRDSLPVYGNGENIRDWIYVRDHCNAIDAILEKGSIGETYLIGSNNEIQNIDIVRMICEYFNKSDINEDNFDYLSLIEFVDDRPGHDFRYAIDNLKIKDKLGWRAQHSFHGALSDTIRWYIDNEEWYRSILKNKNIERLGSINR